jgi:cupin fold WbuC family metalloprotein
MIPLTKRSAEVYFAQTAVATIGPVEIAFLKHHAKASPRKRCRICLHADEQADLHETVLVYTGSTFNRPNRHPMSESFHVLEGRCDILFFGEHGNVNKIVHMGEAKTGMPFICRFPATIFHTLIVRSDWLVVHETCNGPFVRGVSTQYAPWAPDETDAEGIAAFLDRLEANIFVDEYVR